MKPKKEGTEEQGTLETLIIIDKLNNAFIAKGADGVKQQADRLARNQFPNKTFEEFYGGLAVNALLEPQVRAILLSMAEEMRRSQEHALTMIQERTVGAQIKEALRKPRSNPMAEGGTLTGLSRSSIDGLLDEEWSVEDGERSIF